MIENDLISYPFIYSPLEVKDLGLLASWLRKPHVQEYWPDQLSDQEIRNKYQRHIMSDWVFPYFVKLGQEPLGYIQAYQSWKEGNGWWVDETEGTYGLDLYIGEERFLGMGYGSQLLKQFIEEFSKNHPVKKWLIDVDPNNKRAWQCYEKVGFKNLGIRSTPEGPAHVLILEQNREHIGRNF